MLIVFGYLPVVSCNYLYSTFTNDIFRLSVLNPDGILVQSGLYMDAILIGFPIVSEEYAQNSM